MLGSLEGGVRALGPHLSTLESEEDQSDHYLEPLLAQLTLGDYSPAQILSAKRLIRSFSHVFSRHEFDICCFSGVHHEIDTGVNRPVKLGMRRTPVHFQGKEEKHLHKILECGAIEPSTSE